MNLSVTLLTRNSGKTLRQCLASVAFADDIVILDGNSTDDTKQIAAEFGARVYPQYETSEENVVITNFTDLRKKSFSLAKHDWIMYIDSDEYLDETLAASIQNIVNENNITKVGFFDRHPLVDGKEIKHAYFLPDFVARLINVKSGIVWKDGATVHESFVYPKEIKKENLPGVLYSYWPNAEDCLKKDNYYLKLSREKLERDLNKKTIYDMWRGFWINIIRAKWILLRVLYCNIRFYNKGALPLTYHLRFVRYHLIMAASKDKWLLLIKHKWNQLPKFFKNVLYVAILVRIIALVALIALGGQDALVYNVNGDAVDYVNIAHNLVVGNGYSLNTEAPFIINDYRAPGYPALLIALGGAWHYFIPTAIFQNILSLALILIVYRFVRKELNEKAARIAALFTAFEPNMIFWPQQLVTETVHTFFIVIAIIRLYYFVTTRKTSTLLWGIGFLVIATYVRPASYPLLYLIPLLPLFVKTSFKTRIIQIIASFALVGALITPWMYHNQQALGAFQFAPAFATRGSVGKYLTEYAHLKFGKLAHEAYPELSGPYDENPTDASKIISLVVKTAIKDPLTYAKIATKFTAPFFVGDGWYTMYITYRGHQDTYIPSAALETSHLSGIATFIAQQNPVYITGKVVYGFFSLAMFVGLITLLITKKTRLLGCTLTLIIAYYTLVAGVGSYARFRYPAQPFMFIAVSALVLINKKTAQRGAV